MTNGLPHQPTSVFLVEDHPLIRLALRVVLEKRDSLVVVCGEADCIQSTLDHPAIDHAQIAVVDITLNKENGADLVPLLVARGIRVLVYSMHEDAAMVRLVMAAGASAYVTKRDSAECLMEAIHAVRAGITFISPRAAAALAEHAADPDLSHQQHLLYDLLGQGYDAPQIAARLKVSPRTVETYCSRLMDKFGVNGMKELRRRAIADRLSFSSQ